MDNSKWCKERGGGVVVNNGERPVRREGDFSSFQRRQRRRDSGRNACK